jgi:hypothetical protein
MLADDIVDCTVNYLIGDRSTFNKESSLFQNLFVAYLTDKNSSTLREAATLKICNVFKIDKKHGADGKNPVTGNYVEVKPEYAHLNNGKQTKLCGGGTFNDIHFEKVKGCKGWELVVSGFAEDKLIFVFRFPFDFLAPTLNSFIERKIESNKKKGKDQTQGRFSTKFGFSKYYNCPDLEIIYFNREHGHKFMSKKYFKYFSEKYDREFLK